MSDYFDPNNEELLNDFFMEATQQIEMLEQNILAIENNPGDKEAIDEIFRAAHTLKGSSATVQMEELAGFTHILEDLLDEIRSDKVTVTGDVVDVLLTSIDTIKSMINERQEGSVFKDDISDLKNQLVSFLGKGGAPASAVPEAEAKPAAPAVVLDDVSSAVSEYEMLEMQEAAGEGKVLQVSVYFDEANPMNSVGGIQVYARLKEKGTLLKTVPDFEKLYEDTYWPVVEYFLATDTPEDDIERQAAISDVTTKVVVKNLNSDDVTVQNEPAAPVSPAPVKSAQPAPQAAVKSPAQPVKTEEAPLEKQIEDARLAQDDENQKRNIQKKKTKNATSAILRVDSKRIDNLLNLVSEAVINKASFNQISNQFVDITTELNLR